MADDFASYRSGLDSPAEYASVVTPNDSADLATDARSLLLTGSGNVRIVTSRGDEVLIQNVVAPFLLPIRTRKVFATSTTIPSGNIIALR